MKAVLSEKGQVTVLKPLRERLGLRPGHILDLREERGRLVACELVWTEVASMFPSPALARESVERLAVEFSSVNQEAALAVAAAWKA